MKPKQIGRAAVVALVLLTIAVLGALAQTSALDALAGKRFGMPIISRGDNVPDFEPMKDGMLLLLVALHKDIPVSDFQAKMGFGPEKMDGILRFLEGKNYLHRLDGRLEPSIFIADADDGRRLFERAQPIATEIVDMIKTSLPSIKDEFSRTGMARGRRFDDWAFFILSDVLLDNWQIGTVEHEFLNAPMRPLRHGKHYYAALLEKNPKNEPFGIYGNQVGNISVYGNNRWRVEATATENKISAADAAVLEMMARDFAPKLLAVLEKMRDYAERTFAETGYSKEVEFNEFYIWWYHFIYTRATDLMAEAGMLAVPPDGNFLYEMLDR
jgi:hypothetical protein